MKPEQDNAKGAYSSSGFSFKYSNDQKQPAETNPPENPEEMPENSAESMNESTEYLNYPTIDEPPTPEANNSYEPLTEREMVRRLNSMAKEEETHSQNQLDEETDEIIDNKIDEEKPEEDTSSNADRRSTPLQNDGMFEDQYIERPNKDERTDYVSTETQQPDSQELIELEEQEVIEEPAPLDERYLEMQALMLELLISIKESQEEIPTEAQVVDPSQLRELHSDELELQANEAASRYQRSKTDSLEEDGSLWSGWLVALIGIGALSLGLGVIWWAVSSTKEAETDKKDDKESLDTDTQPDLIVQKEEPNLIEAEQTDNEITDELTSDASEDTPTEEENAKPTSKNIEITLEGDSPYIIGKEGFHFDDKDNDPMRGFVIKSVPDEGEISAKGEIVTKETFYKMQSIDEIDDLDLTYALTSDESAGVLEFAFVSGTSVVNQQFSENYQISFERSDTSVQAGPAYSLDFDMNDLQSLPALYYLI